MNLPEIQVAVLAYNHLAYIEQCLNSILNQTSQYKIEILVFEDCSTDGTQDLLKQIAAKHVGKVRLLMSNTNMGGHNNLRSKISNLTAPFIAIIDGDDYWVDMSKVQKSIDFLKANVDFVGYAQNVNLLTEDKNKGSNIKLLHPRPLKPNRHSVHELIAGGKYHHTSALIYRNVFGGKYPATYQHLATGDWFLSILFAEHGDFYYEHYLGSVYRIHSQGVWSRLKPVDQQMLNLDSAYIYNKLLEGKYEKRFARYFVSCARLIPKLVLARKSWPVILKYIFLLGTYPLGPLRYLPTRSLCEKIYEKLQTHTVHTAG